MAKCPYCKSTVKMTDLKTEKKGMGFFKQEIMYICPNCDCIISVSRGNYR